MEAVIECVRNTVGEGVRRMRRSPTSSRKKPTLTMQDKEKPDSKLFGLNLEEVCGVDDQRVPFIVWDLCEYIKQNHLSSEGLFRLSAPATQTSRLRRAYEQHYDLKRQRKNIIEQQDEKADGESKESDELTDALSKSSQVSVANRLHPCANTAACVLKYFFRTLASPLIPDTILQVTSRSKCDSDESFALSIRERMIELPGCYLTTLQFLLSFLRCVLRNADNRMNVNGLAIVFGPNVFTLAPLVPPSSITSVSPSGNLHADILERQTTANQAFERLLLASEQICDNKILHSSDHHLSSMASQYLGSGGDDVIATKCDVTTSKRSRKSSRDGDDNDQAAVTKRGNRSGDIAMRGGKQPQYDDHGVISDDAINTSPCSSGSFEGGSSPASSDSSESSLVSGGQVGGAEDKVARDLIGQMIKNVVRRHLFSSDTNLSCGGGEEAASASPPRDNLDDDEKMICNNHQQQISNHRHHQAYESFRAVDNNNVTTDNDVFSGNETTMMTSHSNDDDHVFDQRHRREYGYHDDVATVKDTATSGKQAAALSDEDLCEVTQLIQVPRLDLSQVIMLSGNNAATTTTTKNDEFLLAACSKDEAPKPKPRVLSCPQQIPQDNHKVKHHHRRRKKASSNHHHSVDDNHDVRSGLTMESHLVKSAPIDIPQKSFNNQQQKFDDNMLMDALSSSPSQGGGSPSRWRDAWSTDDEAPVVALSSGSINHVPAVMDIPDDMDMAPSSPTEHYEGYHRRHNHLRHHHHHHKRHPYHHGKTGRHVGNDDVTKHGDNNSSGESISNQEDEQTLRVDELSENLDRILKALCKNRDDAGRPEDITLMTRQQIRAEKMAMQKELLKFETDRGRPTAKWERDIMRDIYDRYRTVKRLLADTLSPTFPSQTLHHRRLVHHHTPTTDECDFLVTREIATVEPATAVKTPTSQLAMAEKGKLQKEEEEEEEEEEPVVVEGEVPTCTQVQVSGDTNIMELRKQHQEAKHKKKKLRRRIRDFEREFKHQHQRAPTHVDMVVMATEYSEYREVRARLRLLEALIEKQH